jgi:hypothetical protein
LVEDTPPRVTPFQYHPSSHNIDGGMQQDEQCVENLSDVDVPTYGASFRRKSSLQDSRRSSQYAPTSGRHSSVYMTPGRVIDGNHGYIVHQGDISAHGGDSTFTALDSGVRVSKPRGRSSWPPQTMTSLSSRRSSDHSAYSGYVDLNAKGGETKGRYMGRVRPPTLMLASTMESEEHNDEGSAEGEQEQLEERQSQVSTHSPQSPVVVHRDAGWVEPIQVETQLNVGLEEIPPTYDSLRTN